MYAATLVLALCAFQVAQADDLWTPHIDNGPAPAPSLRPPISRNATLDPSLLKWQIPALIGSYVVVVSIIGISILTFGKRMRRDALTGAKPISIEMVKPSKNALEVSPVSPAGSNIWNRWGSPHVSKARSDASRSPHTPHAPSIVSFDAAVLEQDRVKREEEMAKIYGEIVNQSQHIRAPSSINVRGQAFQQEQNPTSPGLQQHFRTPSTSSRSFSQRNPPQREMSQRSQRSVTSQTTLPMRSSGSVHAIYPPTADPRSANSLNPASRGFYPTDMLAPSPSVAPTSSRYTTDESGAPPPYSHSRQPSRASDKSRQIGRTSSIRSLPISDPIPIPTLEDEIATEARMPRSPRYYKDPGRPPTPPMVRRERPSTMIEDDSDDEILSPTLRDGDQEGDYSDEEILTDDEDDRERHNNWSPDAIIGSYGEPRTPRTPRTPMEAQSNQRARTERRPAIERLVQQAQSPVSPAFPLDNNSPPRTTAPAFPLADNSPPRTTTPAQSSIRSQTKTPPALVIPPHQPAPASSVPQRLQTRTPPQRLQIRAIHPPQTGAPEIVSPPLRSPGRSPGLPYSPGQMISPGGTKTTFLSPRRDAFPGGLAPMSALGLAPSTARLFETGMATPYSPYMPYTPMTPATPHMTTRAERREQERQRGRFAATEEDIVEDERDMWGDAYRED